MQNKQPSPNSHVLIFCTVKYFKIQLRRLSLQIRKLNTFLPKVPSLKEFVFFLSFKQVKQIKMFPYNTEGQVQVMIVLKCLSAIEFLGIHVTFK